MNDRSSREGEESGRDEPGMRVTGFKLKEATADEIFQRGGEQRDDGILCRTRVTDSDYKSEEWTHIRWSDEQMCDKTKNCMNGLDEPEVCQPVIVTGSI